MSINAPAVRRDLDPFWRELQAVDETGSTNDDLLAAATDGAAEGLVRIADFQRAGRGRLDRAWESPAGSSLMFSVLLRPTAPVATWGWIPLITGIAVHEVLADAGLDAALKWPNDIQLGPQRGKCGGVLTQAVNGAAIVGIGLNVLPHDAMPDGAAAIGEYWTKSREQMLAAFLNAIARRYLEWNSAGGQTGATGLLAAYRAACGTVGQTVRVSLPGHQTPTEGVGEQIDDDGRLVVRTDSGHLVVGAGDVVHVRPAQ